jgi:hypothetical protein
MVARGRLSVLPSLLMAAQSTLVAAAAHAPASQPEGLRRYVESALSAGEALAKGTKRS